ncbi:hypothetical protein OG905_23590 [Streptomyces sp. NBC_00322]|uniref:hypothetical protein n=1 Tax=Streptomyces sp. NBC_00322 TaxID=2975712 RepID=UPI002E27D9B1|nr:hypothetical protein [Streptomyces sp. NBC_00322]
MASATMEATQRTATPAVGHVEVRDEVVADLSAAPVGGGQRGCCGMPGGAGVEGGSRSNGYWTRVILSFAYVAGGEYEDEAAVAVRQFTMLKDVLPDCMGIVYVGALRGIHRDALARRGIPAITPHRKRVPTRAEAARLGAGQRLDPTPEQS